MSQWASLYKRARGPTKDDSRSVDIEDRMYVFTLLVVLNLMIIGLIRKLRLHTRLCKFLMKLWKRAEKKQRDQDRRSKQGGLRTAHRQRNSHTTEQR